MAGRMTRDSWRRVGRWALLAEVALVLYVNVTLGVWLGLLVAVVSAGLYYAIFNARLRE